MNVSDMLSMGGLLQAQGAEMERMAAVIDRYDAATDRLLDEISDTLDFVIQRIEAGDIAGCLAYCKARRTKIHGGLDDAVADEIIRQIRQEDDGEIREKEA
jgi:hypothetical protein